MKRTVVITGANRGLGLALVKKFSVLSDDIVCCTRTLYPEFIGQCKNMSEQYGNSMHNIAMDLEDEDSVRRGLREMESLPCPDVLINNASCPYDKILMFTGMKELKRVFQVNYFSPCLITRDICKRMIKRGGAIINISSVSSMTRQGAGTAYSASKAAINQFTVSLAQEVAAYKIRVNAVAPGAMGTGMFAQTNDRNKDVLINSTAMRRMACVEEVADVVAFLASDEASYITGQIIRVDGGLSQ